MATTPAYLSENRIRFPAFHRVRSSPPVASPFAALIFFPFLFQYLQRGRREEGARGD